MHSRSSEPASTTHQQKLRRPQRSCDQESPSMKHSLLRYKSTTGRKQHIQGDGFREDGLWRVWICGFRCFQCSGQSCSCLWHREIPGFRSGYEVNTPTAPFAYPWWQGSLPTPSQSTWSYCSEIILAQHCNPFVIFLGKSLAFWSPTKN